MAENWTGVCAGFAFGEETGVGRGVAAGFKPELAGNAAGDPLLLAKFESRAFWAAAELDRSADFLLAFVGAAARVLAFEFLLSPGPLLAESGKAIRLLTLEFGFDSARVVDRGITRAGFEATAELEPAPATVNTTSSRFERCSTRAVAPGGRRKEMIVLSPLRCTFTSAKPRPRSASARGTSLAGILI